MIKVNYDFLKNILLTKLNYPNKLIISDKIINVEDPNNISKSLEEEVKKELLEELVEKIMFLLRTEKNKKGLAKKLHILRNTYYDIDGDYYHGRERFNEVIYKELGIELPPTYE